MDGRSGSGRAVPILHGVPPAKIPPSLRTGPFTVRQAEAAGLTRSALRSSVWRNPFRDVYVLAELEETLTQRLAALRLVLPGHAVACGLTAAWLHGADVRRQDDLTIHVVVPPDRRIRRREGLVVAESTLSADDVVVIDGVQVTSPLKTAYDCARTLALVEGVVVADALAHADLLTVEDLAAYVACHRKARGVRRADEVVRQVEPLSESPMESRLRMGIVLGGLPRPRAQLKLYDDRGWFVGRVDLAWEDARIVIEYDGAHHWKQRLADDRRRGAIADLGWEVRVYGADDVYNRQDYVCAQLMNLRNARLVQR